MEKSQISGPGRDFWKEFWEKKKAKSARIRSSGRVVIKSNRGNLHVICPHSEDFTKGAMDLAGKWKYRSQVWVFKAFQMRVVLDLIYKVFGEDQKIDFGKGLHKKEAPDGQV